MIWLLMPLAAILAAWSGGSMWPSQYIPKWLTWLPEALFAAVVGFVYLVMLSGWWMLLAIPATAWTYLWMQTGHANALNHGDNADPDRENTLTPLVDWLADKFGIEQFSREYSALFFAVKGFLIGLPLGGLPLAILWPLSYDIGVMMEKKGILKHEKAHMTSELLSGAGLGLLAALFLIITKRKNKND